MKQGQRTTGVTMRGDRLLSDVDKQVVDLAFSLWLAGGFSGASPQDVLLDAARSVKGSAWSGLFPVPKEQSRARDADPSIRSKVKLYWCSKDRTRWFAFSPDIGWVVFPAEIDGWTRREPCTGVDRTTLREVPVRMGFHTGIPGAPISSRLFLVPKTQTLKAGHSLRRGGT